MAKYELTNMSIEHDGHVLYRIRAISNIGQIKKGELGGYVESENNLSQCGKCWVYDGACVYGNARVTENATIHDSAVVKDSAIVSGSADIGDDVIISGNCRIKDNVTILDHAIISGDAVISKDAFIGDVALIDGNAKIGKHAIIRKRGDYVLIEHIGFDVNYPITIYNGYAGYLLVNSGRFRGPIEDFWKQIKSSDILTRKTKRMYKHLLKSVVMSMTETK